LTPPVAGAFLNRPNDERETTITRKPSSEVELKLEVDARDLARLKDHALLQGLAPAKTLVSTYFDTPDFRLRKKGLSLRVRFDGRDHVQTVKTAAESAGLQRRGEWETKLSSDRPDLAAVAGASLTEALDGQAATLGPRFSMEVLRRQRIVRRDGAEVEISLDEGEVSAGERREPLMEIELELKRGEAAALFDLAAPLFEAAAPRLSVRSKAEAGYALIDAAPLAYKSTPVGLDRAMTSAEGFQAIGRSCLAQFVRNERLVRASRRPEAVHQARVGIRRLRAAISIFKPLLGDPQSERLKAGLRQAGADLGAARDLDVLIERMNALELMTAFDKESLMAALERRRDEAYDAAVAALRTPQVARLTFDVAAWLEAGDWLRSADPARRALTRRPLVEFAAADLDRRARSLRKAAPKIRKFEAFERHQVRIKAKKVRYGAEFFASLAKGSDNRKAARGFIAALKPFQDALGELNDLVNGERLLRVIAENSRDPNLAFAAGASVDEIERRTGLLLKAAEKAAADFAKAKPFLD
jgi:inorganic triphosphatase YgiF